MSRIEGSCNWIEKNIRSIKNTKSDSNITNIVKCLKDILASIKYEEEIPLSLITSLSINIDEYNEKINNQ